jgi:hypothetical protein
MSKKWDKMTKTQKLDLLRDEVDKLKRDLGDGEKSPPNRTKKGRKAERQAARGAQPFST